MKFVKQFGIILLLSFLGELLHAFLPLTIPASIYGIVILFLCLEFKVISVSAVKDVFHRDNADHVYPGRGGADGFLADHKGGMAFLCGDHGAFHICGYGGVRKGGTACHEADKKGK